MIRLRLFPFRSLLLVFSLLAASGAQAIIVRHDKSDSDYVVEPSAYASVCRVSGFAEGTLVGDRWVLTAAHVAMGLTPFNGFVEIGGKAYFVEKALFHPKAVRMSAPDLVDMALLKLRKPVTGVKPVKLYSGKDEVGKIITFVGRGDTGTGLTGPAGNDGKTRAARNRIEEVNDRQIIFVFDQGEAALPTEGISGPGDSGSPALLEIDGELYVLGVSNSNSIPPGEGHCTYGTKEYYARVSTALDWIVDTMAGKDAPHWGWHEPVLELEPSKKKECIEAFVAAYNKMDRGAMEEFDQTWKSEVALARRTPDASWQMMSGLQSRLGRLKPRGYAVRDQGGVAVVFEMPDRDGYVALRFIFARSEEVKLFGFAVVPLRSLPPFLDSPTDQG